MCNRPYSLITFDITDILSNKFVTDNAGWKWRGLRNTQQNASMQGDAVRVICAVGLSRNMCMARIVDSVASDAAAHLMKSWKRVGVSSAQLC